ncbi:MAG: hypothetical protein HY856_13685 [Burkholderiales bacterium]|nr:hypothetical protein [Burkholderiales bacterium]
MTNEQLDDCPSPRDEAVAMLGARLAKSTDSIVNDAITQRLGEGWTLDSLRGRLTCVHQLSSGMATFCLDGKPLVRFFPTITRMEGTTLRVSQPYRLL